MLVRWSDEAADDLERIALYLEERSPASAQRVVKALFAGAEGLAVFPHRGRPGRIDGTRELVFPTLGYLIVYEAGPEAVRIARILHGAQDRSH